ncbi:MAG TPA: ABC transporter ATP-binding protein [Anaerolineae bacterium]|nr:ABC transporter ATP-binding protein [Anaerolineae bacterium]
MAEIRIQNLVKVFPGGTRAVDGVSIHVADGEFLVLLGPSGCGKTTTLRCVAGLERQTRGDIHIGDRLVNALPPADRDIAFVFQFYALYPHLSAYDNIAFPLKAAQLPKSEVDQRVHHVAEMLKINHLLNRRPKRLSSGEQQRVALGRAIVRRPQVFLLDEPLTNMDSSLRADMRVELKHLQQELGTTTLYVTHDQTEAMALGHKIAVMDAGKLQQVGAPLEVYNHPATLFVAGFIGSPPMNLLDVTLAAGPALVDPDGAFRLPVDAALAEKWPTLVPLKLGVRSEDLHIAADPSAGDMPAEVYVVEPLGDETIYSLRFAGSHVMLAKAPPALDLKVGDKVGVSFDRSRLHVFDVQTGKALR